MWELVISTRNTFLHAEWTADVDEELVKPRARMRRRSLSCPPGLSHVESNGPRSHSGRPLKPQDGHPLGDPQGCFRRTDGEARSGRGDGQTPASEQSSYDIQESACDMFPFLEALSESPPDEEPRGGEGQLRSIQKGAGASSARGSQGGAMGTTDQRGDARADRPLLTLVMNDIPVRCKEEDLLATIRASGFTGRFEFVYLPMKFGLRKNRGYAFAAFSDPESAAMFYQAMHGVAVSDRKSGKAISVEVAKSCVSAEHMQILRRNASQWGTVLSESR